MDELIVREGGLYKRYEDLLLKRDQLYKEAGSINTAYVKEFGDLLLKDFELKVECIKKRKMIAYCIGAVNHGRAIDVQKMNAEVEHTMALYYHELKQMAEQKSEADKSKTTPLYKVDKAKRIYKRIAKMIHPDINPAAASDENIRELWGRVVVAYHCNDDVELGNLEILIKRVLKDLGEDISGVTIDGIEERIAVIEEEINSIITCEPYTWLEILSSSEKTAIKKKELQESIDESAKYSEELSKTLQDIISGGGVPLTWILE